VAERQVLVAHDIVDVEPLRTEASSRGARRSGSRAATNRGDVAAVHDVLPPSQNE
jgi:hypothetical protein